MGIRFTTTRRAQLQRALAILAILTPPALGLRPIAEEQAEARRWVAAKFEGVSREAPVAAGLYVMANHGPVQLNSRGGEPLRIGRAEYQRGLYCHAPSKVLVRLPSPGRTFSAVVGVDSRAGGGSIAFAVHGGVEPSFRSPILGCGGDPLPVSVNLNESLQFILEVTDGGDGISSDQANWADAKVLLADGRELWLGEMSLQPPPPVAFDSAPPFSFVYGGRSSVQCLPEWKVERTHQPRDDASVSHELTYTDPQTGLVVRCDAIEWLDFPTVEWTLHLKNTGSTDTPIIEALQAIDASFDGAGPAGATLHYNSGDQCTPDSYEPHVEAWTPPAERSFACVGGRPTTGAFPYFNLARPDGGAIVVLSWAGQWAMTFGWDDWGKPRIHGGQERTHFTLHPGEEVRTPMAVVQFYKGDWLRGQNIWRSWMVEHNLPRPAGKLVQPMASLCTGNYYPGLMSNAAQELDFLRKHIEAGVRFDGWWQDAGWYPCEGVTWPKTGTWEVDAKRFPKGLREVSDFVHAHGMRSIVWFEPERVAPGTWLYEKHPEWLLGENGAMKLLNLGDPQARAWLTDHIDHLLTEQAIDLYREDFNIDPLPFWRAHDAPDRQGMTEALHVAGHFAFWDELRRRHPGLLIDSCASGGRRNDLETLRRAVPLLRSDWYSAPDGQQCQTYGLSLWLPFQGTGVIYQQDEYWHRSSFVAEFTFGPGGEGLQGVDLDRVRRMVEEHRRMGTCFYGDFYPLTSYCLGAEAWMAWQYDEASAGRGVIQVFRRSESPYESARFKLQGLNAAADYKFDYVGGQGESRLTGKELLDPGLRIELPERASAITFFYGRITTP